MSAEPQISLSRQSSVKRFSAALNALDLDNLDLRNIDPILASQILDEIRNGADVGPLLEKLKRCDQSGIYKSVLVRSRAEKMVTFEDEMKNRAAVAGGAVGGPVTVASAAPGPQQPKLHLLDTKLNADDVLM